MIQTQSLRRRSWAGIAWLLVIGVAVLVALALGQVLVLLVTLVAAALAGSLLLRERVPALAPRVAAPTFAGAEPRAQLAVVAADGSPRQALVVPAESAAGYQTVLTIDGYALINAEGRIIYALNRELRASSAEPVTVTTMDAEAESNEPVMVSVADAEGAVWG